MSSEIDSESRLYSVNNPFGLGEDLSFMIYVGIKEVIELLQRELLSEISYPKDYPPEWPRLNSLFKNDFPYWVRNEILLDLYACYKQGEIPYTGRDHLERRIRSSFRGFVNFFWSKIDEFSKNFHKLQQAYERQKKKEVREMVVPQPTEPMRIPLNIRFAIIKRANGRCEGCGSSIFDSPIEVYQIYSRDQTETISFVAYCAECRQLNDSKIIPEP